MEKPTTSVRVSRAYAHSPERVFDAWTIPQEASKFLFATPTGQITKASIDARPGGAFTIVDRRDGEDVEHTGLYLTVERPKRLIFTFCVPKYAKEMTRVILEFNASAKGCELTLTHEGVRTDYAERSKDGWKKMLEVLDAMLRAGGS